MSDKDDLDAVLPMGVVRSLLARTLCFRVFKPCEQGLGLQIHDLDAVLPVGVVCSLLARTLRFRVWDQERLLLLRPLQSRSSARS